MVLSQGFILLDQIAVYVERVKMNQDAGSAGKIKKWAKEQILQKNQKRFEKKMMIFYI